jgi:transposase
MATTTAPEQAAQGIEQVLALSLELAGTDWKLAFSPGLGQQPRLRVIAARDLSAVQREVAAAKARFNLPAGTRVVSCYEAGRDGFWLHRALVSMGIENKVVDSASIEVSRRQRRAKTDRLDAGALVGLLLRYIGGEKRALRVVRVPPAEEEDRRQLHRELMTAKRDRTAVTNRIKSILYAHGIRLTNLDGLPALLRTLRMWNGELLPEQARARIARDWEELEQLEAKIRLLQSERGKRLRTGEDAGAECARKLMQLCGIGASSAWLFAREFFGWREFKNRRQVGGLAELAPTPYQSGTSRREQGICKAGNRWIRATVIEVAWGWLRYQPNSELSRWYERRFAHGGPRVRKIGIVALARRLLVELWKYLETGTPPAGAKLKTMRPRTA